MVAELRNAFKLMKHPAVYLFKATGKEDKLRWTGAIKDAIDGFMRVGPKVPEAPLKVVEKEAESSDSEEEGKIKSRRKKLSAFFGDTSNERKKKAAKGPEPEVPSGTKLRANKSFSEGASIKVIVEEKIKEIERPQEKATVDLTLVKQITEMSEELDVFIAQRQFEQAITLIDSGLKIIFSFLFLYSHFFRFY